MEIETVSNPEHETEIKFENLKPGTVFEFAVGDKPGKGPKALKLSKGQYILLSYSNDNGVGPIDIGDGSMLSYGVRKVYGKLVGLKVQL